MAVGQVSAAIGLGLLGPALQHVADLQPGQALEQPGGPLSSGGLTAGKGLVQPGAEPLVPLEAGRVQPVQLAPVARIQISGLAAPEVIQADPRLGPSLAALEPLGEQEVLQAIGRVARVAKQAGLEQPSHRLGWAVVHGQLQQPANQFDERVMSGRLATVDEAGNLGGAHGCREQVVVRGQVADDDCDFTVAHPQLGLTNEPLDLGDGVLHFGPAVGQLENPDHPRGDRLGRRARGLVGKQP